MAFKDHDLRELTAREKNDIVQKVEWEGGIVEAFIHYGLASQVAGTELEEPLERLTEAYNQIKEIVDGYEADADDGPDLDDNDDWERDE